MLTPLSLVDHSVSSRLAILSQKSGRGGASAAADAAAKAAGVGSNKLKLEEARQILNLEPHECTKKAVWENFDKYFKANSVENGGSFYIQSKFYRAKEVLDLHMKKDESRPPNPDPAPNDSKSEKK